MEISWLVLSGVILSVLLLPNLSSLVGQVSQFVSDSMTSSPSRELPFLQRAAVGKSRRGHTHCRANFPDLKGSVPSVHCSPHLLSWLVIRLEILAGRRTSSSKDLLVSHIQLISFPKLKCLCLRHDSFSL